jgi:DNA-binding XRE family transcriptional regulator
MSKKTVCEWIIGDNLGGDRWFIVHASAPYFIAEFCDAGEERAEAVLDSFSYSGGGYDLFNFVWQSSLPDEKMLRRLLARAVEAIGAHATRTDEMLDLEEADSIGERIKLLREQAAMTQAELAATAKIPQPNICAIENDQREATVETLRKIAKALGVGIEQLLE